MGGDIERYVRQEARTLAPCVSTWQAMDGLRERLRPGIELEVQRTQDMERARSFRELVARDGTADEDFLQYEADLGGDRHAVLGLRFKGGPTGPPFVNLCAKDFEVQAEADLVGLLTAARERYAKFSPIWLNVGVGAHEGWLQATGAPCRADQFWYAGLVTELQARPAPEGHAALELETLTNTAFHAHYLEIFASLHAESPFHRREVNPQPEDSFANSIEHGCCFRALVDGETAGYIAALRTDFSGMRGYLALELLLHSDYRGRGMAPIMQRKLIDSLDGSANAIFCGEIDPGNKASVATARRCGRMHVGGRWWIDL